MLYGREYGIVFSDAGYRFVAWDADAARFRDVQPAARWMLRELDDDIAIATACWVPGAPVADWTPPTTSAPVRSSASTASEV